MRAAVSTFLLIGAAGTLAGCGGSDGLALNRDRPDEFAVQRQQDETLGFIRMAEGFQGLGDLAAARHENQHVSLPAGSDIPAECIGVVFPDRPLVQVSWLCRVRGLDR